jgi:hypothetical protein
MRVVGVKHPADKKSAGIIYHIASTAVPPDILIDIPDTDGGKTGRSALG